MKQFTITAEGLTGDGFIVRFLKIDDIGVDFEINKIDSTDIGVTPVNLFMIGHIKWDSCSNFQFIEDYHHFCGVNHFIMLNRTIEFLWTKARELYTIEFQKNEYFDVWDNEDITIIISEDV